MTSPDRPLPEPTRDVARAKADLDAAGYCIVEGVLTDLQVQALRERVVAQAAGEARAGVATHDSGTNQRIWMLVNKGRAFRDLVVHPFVAEFMSHLLGEDFLLSSATANIARPGGDPMQLHTDQGYVDFWTPKPVVANVAWMLDAFSDENGGTRLIPGSHLSPAWREARNAPSVAAAGPAGSALVFDGRLVHGTGANRTRDSQRHGILTYYCRPFMRQQENFFLGLDPAVEAAAGHDLLRRLGYTIQHGLGRVEKPGQQGPMSRLHKPVPALDAGGRAIRAERGLFAPAARPIS